MLKQTSLAMLLCAGSILAQNFTVKVPDSPKPYEASAAEELKAYLTRRIGDGTLTIDGKSPITFQIGDTALAKANGLLSTEQPEEKWFIKSIGDQVILNGGGTRGALYATYHFLEDFCGVHWWNDFEDYVPKASSLELAKLDASGKPAFLYRDLYRTLDSSPRTSIRNRLNRCGDVQVPKELGGSFNYGPPYHCHTFDKYVPADKYLATHPEYFSLHGDQRVGGQGSGQLCLTNPELKKIFLENLMKFIEEGYAKAAEDGVPAPRIYEVSMNDNRGKCECPACNAEAEKYGQSGLYLNFVNWIAREVKKTHPEIYISTLAYFYTEPPPQGGVRADDNVIVKLCDTQTNQAASILEPDNKVFFDFVAQWKNYAKNLFIWDYAITFSQGVTGLPFASELHYGDLYKYYLENNVAGIFWEHEEPHVADLYELKFFVECKLFEDPYQDVNKLIDTFLTCYYGDAAPFILEYRKAIDAARKANKGFISWFPSADDFKYITIDDILKCQKLFTAAEAAVSGDKVLSARVRHARCGLDRLECTRGCSIPYHGKNTKKIDARLDVANAAKRQLQSWPDWCRQFPNGSALAENAANWIRSKANPDQKQAPVPELFKDRNYYDFCANTFSNQDPGNLKLVKDADCLTGEAVRIDIAGSAYYNPPFIMGLYQRTPPETRLNKQLEIQQEPGYHWYCAGKAKVTSSCYIFMNRAWTNQIEAGYEELIGKEFEFWASIKFTGPKYRPGDEGADYIYIERFLLVEPQE